MTNEARERLLSPTGPMANLEGHQVQLDADGVMVGVSRQALDEVLADLRALLDLTAKGEVAFSAREVMLFDLAWDLVVAIRGVGPLPHKSPEEIADLAVPILGGLIELRNTAYALAHTGGGDE